MKTEKVLQIALREIHAYVYGWRVDWSNFDERIFSNQLDHIKDWVIKAIKTDGDIAELRSGTEFNKSRWTGLK